MPQVNILIVDDLPEKLLVFETILEPMEANLISVRSGREALQQILLRDFAVILLDVNMPGIDGFETASLIRQYHKTRKTPIIFITSYIDDVQTARGYALGAVDYISAPGVPEILRSKVGVFVDLPRLHLQVQRQSREHEAVAIAEAARANAEAATRRADLLAEASHTRSRSLDTNAIADALLQFMTRTMADTALVVITAELGGPATIKLAQRTPLYEQRELSSLPPFLLDALRGDSSWEPLFFPEPRELVFTEQGGATVSLPIARCVLFPGALGARIKGTLAVIDQKGRDNFPADIALVREVVSHATHAFE